MLQTKQAMIDKEGEVRELTANDLKQFRPAADALPANLQSKLEMRSRGPQKTPTKIQTTIRFDPDVLAGLRATGRGWQTRVNDAMREWLQAHHS